MGLEENSAYHVDFAGQLAGEPGHFQEHVDAVMTELLRLDVSGPAIGGTASTGDIEIAVEVNAASIEEAIEKGAEAIHAAMQAAGARTPEWREATARSVEPAV